MLTYKYAQKKDLENLVNFINQAYRGEFAKNGWTTEADILDGQRTDEASLLEILNTPHNKILLAFEENDLACCVHLKFESETSLYFGMLTTHPLKQNLGIGKKILLEIENIARSKDLKQIRISVIPLRIELISYYERRGFVRTGRYEEFPSDPKFGIPKVSGLRLDEFIKQI